MGRKQNQAQRTKGNAKPSSSSRAAELLEASGGASAAAVGFLGFGAAAQETDDLDYGMDSDFALVLKKMTKRDSTTKLKAMQEFGRLCQEKDLESVTAVLQYWPKVFSRMTIDSDRRVRESTNESFEQLIVRVRRSLAPHLKCIMGPWLVAQCDVYAPSASAARSAFRSAFTAERQADAVGFCKVEILTHITDNLFKLSAQTLTDAKTQQLDSEDSNTKYERILSSSLEALNLFIVRLPSKDRDSVIDQFGEILKNSKFWKFSKHSAGPVRAGFFDVLSGLCQAFPQLVVQFSAQICPAVLYSLDEVNPSVIPALWQSILLTITTEPDWSSKINARKGLFPKLWSLLKNGGYGCAVVSYPNLLPFVSLVPIDTDGERIWFYERFLNDMKTGLSTEQIQRSPSELNAVVKAFVECVQYWIKKHLIDPSDDQKLLNYLVTEQIVPMIEASVVNDNPALSRSRLYSDVVGLLTFIWNLAETVEEERREVVEGFYAELMERISERILSGVNVGSAEALDRISEFLEEFSPRRRCRQSGKPLKERSRRSVKFVETEVDEMKREDEKKTSSVDVAKTTEDETKGRDFIERNDEKEEEEEETNRFSTTKEITGNQRKCIDDETEDRKMTKKSNDSMEATENQINFAVDVNPALDDDNDSLSKKKKEVKVANDLFDVATTDSNEDSRSARSVLLKPDGAVLRLVNRVCCVSLKRSRADSSLPDLKLFSRLFEAFADKDLVGNLAKESLPDRDDDSPDGTTTTLTFIRDVLMAWAQEIESKSEARTFVLRETSNSEITETKTETKYGTKTQTKSDIKTETETKSGTKTETETKSETKTETENKSDIKTETKSGTKTGTKSEPKTETQTEMIDHILKTTVVALGLLCGGEKLTMLSTLTTTSKEGRLSYRLLRHLVTNSRDPDVRGWLEKPEFGEFVVSVAERLCRHSLRVVVRDELNDENERWLLLCLVLSTDDAGNLYIKEEYLDLVLAVIVGALSDSRSSAIDDAAANRYVKFSCDVTYQFLTNVRGCVTVPSSRKLLLSLFELRLREAAATALATDVLAKINATWKQGFRLMLAAENGLSVEEGSFLCEAIECLKTCVHGRLDTCAQLERAVDLAFQLWSIVSEVDGAARIERSSSSFLELFVDCLRFGFVPNSEPADWKATVVVAGRMLFTSVDRSSKTVVSSPSFAGVPKCVAPVAFSSSLMLEIIARKEKTAEPKIKDISPRNEPLELRASDVNLTENRTDSTEESSRGQDTTPKEGGKFLSKDLDLLIDLALGLAFCRATTKNRDLVRKSSESVKSTLLLEENYRKITSRLSRATLEKLVSRSFEKSMLEGDLSCLGLQILLQRLQELNVEWDYLIALGGIDRLNPLDHSIVSTLQIAMPFLASNHVSHLAEIQTALILTYVDEDIVGFYDSPLCYLAVFNAAFSAQDRHNVNAMSSFADLFGSVFVQIQTWRQIHDSLFLFDGTTSTPDWNVVVFNVEAIQLFTLAVAKFPTALDASQWDVVVCSAVSWIQTVCENGHRLLDDDDLSALTLASTVFDLLHAVAVCVQSILPEEAGSFPPNLMTEWKEIFSDTAFGLLLPVFLQVVEQLSTVVDISLEVDIMLHSFCSVMVHCPAEVLLQHKLTPRLVAGVDSNLPDNIQTLLNHCCPLMSSGHYCVQITAYRMLGKVVPELPKHDEKTTAVDAALDENEPSQSPPGPLLAVLKAGNQSVRAALESLAFGDSALFDPFTAGYASVMAYLLSWNLVLECFKMASSELRVRYAQWLCDRGVVDSLMQNVFSLMPSNPVVPLKDVLVSNSPSNRLTNCRNLFSVEPSFDVRSSSSPENCAVVGLRHVACSVYRRSLETLPAVLRQWWNGQDKHVSGIVDRFTTRYVSPLLCAQELSVLAAGPSTAFENMTVKARPAAREVVATYAVEESTMELVITLPVNMPFGAITVESNNRVGVTKPQWRNWMLQLIVFLSFQNGSILDGLSLWKRNVDKRFEGLDDCMICFSVVHGSTCELPKLQCKTCKKRFHSTCLYKWFKTSNNSACPLCRNLF